LYVVLIYLVRQVEMAHKVLSKDMSDLVNSMKLAQKYNNTTVEGDYRKWAIIHKNKFNSDLIWCSNSLIRFFNRSLFKDCPRTI